MVLSRPAGENGIKHTYEDYNEDKVLPLHSSLYHIQLASCFYSSVTTENLCASLVQSHSQTVSDQKLEAWNDAKSGRPNNILRHYLVANPREAEVKLQVSKCTFTLSKLCVADVGSCGFYNSWFRLHDLSILGSTLVKNIAKFDHWIGP